MSAQERDESPDVDLAAAVEDAMEPEMRRSLQPPADRPEPSGRERRRPPREREDDILDDLRERGEE
jgi:hypothetical protein